MNNYRAAAAVIVGISAAMLPVGSADAEATRFNCTYPKYASAEGIKIDKNFKLEFTVDTSTGTAVLVGNNGMSPVEVHSGSGTVSFIERLPTGVVQSTTIANTGASVHSRHTFMQGEIVASQYYGTCR